MKDEKTGWIHENRAYQMMLDSARERLKGRDPDELAAYAGALYLKECNALKLAILGRNIVISCSDFTVTPELGSWHHLVLLHYLASAKGVRPTGRKLAFRDMKDGLIRGTKYEAYADRELARILKGRSGDDVRLCMEEMGAVRTDDQGDLSYRIAFLPYFPVYLNIWMADDEFDTAGKLFLDQCADFYLTIEDAVTVGDILLEQMETKIAAGHRSRAKR